MDLLEKPQSLIRRHPWETSRFTFLRRILHKAHVLRPDLRVLDVGAGDAWLGRQMMTTVPGKMDLTCWDKGYGELAVSSDAQIRWCRDRPQGRFDLLLLLDVLEHIPDDRSFLKEIVSLNAAPGSYLLITVPCWPLFFGAHDVRLQHLRRYRPRDCRSLLISAGLNIMSEGNFFHGPLIARALTVMSEKLRISPRPPKDLGQWDHGAGLTRLVTWALTLDNHCSELFARWGWSIPGLSYWALCQKKPSS